MPVLSIDYSRGNATALLVADNHKYKAIYYSINAPEVEFYNKPTKQQVIEDLIKSVCSELNVTLDSDTPIYLSSLRKLDIDMPNVSVCLKTDALQSLYPTEFLYFSHLHVGANNGIFSEDINYKELLSDIFFDEEEDTLRDYFENLKLYPNIKASSDRDIFEESAYLKQIARRYCNIQNADLFKFQKPIILSSTRDLSTESLTTKFLLLALDCLCSEGDYYFKLDYKNFIGSSAPINYFNKELFIQMNFPYFADLGTVIHILDSIECEVTSLNGPKYEFNVKKDDLYALPLSSSEVANLTIQSRKHGTITREIRGGVYGLIIDTRAKDNGKVLPTEERHNKTKEWLNILLRGMEGFKE